MNDSCWQNCAFKNRSECGNSYHSMSETVCVPLLECSKRTFQHLCQFTSIGPKEAPVEPPEALLILYRSGIFNINQSSLSSYICPKHRDELGVYWKRPQRTCQSPDHPPASKSKAIRGLQAGWSKHLWSSRGIFIPVGAGMCVPCARKFSSSVDSRKYHEAVKADISVIDMILEMQKNAPGDCPNHPQEQMMHTTPSNDDNNNIEIQFSSQSTEPNSQSTVSDWEEENMDQKEKFNKAMHILSKDFPSLSYQLRLPWENISKTSSSYYMKIIISAMDLILQYVTPGQESIVKKHLTYRMQTETELKVDTMTEALIVAYNQQTNSNNQKQILSLFAHKYTKDQLLKLIPGITVHKIDAARRHASLTSPGQIVSPPKIFRARLSIPKAMHFIEFISSPIYHQAVGYGSKTLKLSNGLEVKIPKVVRNMMASRIITSYIAYCKEQEFSNLQRSSLFKIVKACAASKKKNMHGLDNITSEGMRAIDIMSDVIKKLEMFGLDTTKVTKFKSLITHVNQHLKFEMKGHVEISSPCAAHCSVHSLSDPTSKPFKEECQHSHDQGCDDCSTVDSLISEMNDVVISMEQNLPNDIKEEIDHDMKYANSSVLQWRAHCIRTVHQENARQNVLANLHPDQCLIIMDWAMKLLPIKHRENQMEFFGKKGISWHVSCVITPSPNSDFTVNTFVHVLELGIQGWFSVAHIIKDIFQYLEARTQIKEAFLKSDNAGCYHSSSLISFLHHLNRDSTNNITVREFNFSEAQSGKDICDAKTAHCKMHILSYSGEGHDILTAKDVREALHANGGVKGVVASVVSIDTQEERKMLTKIPNISFMSNFEFTPNGVICRKAYNVGPGSLIPSSQFKDTSTLNGFVVDEGFPIPKDSGSMKVHVEQQPVPDIDINEQGTENNQEQTVESNAPIFYPCPVQSCNKVYTKVCFLDNHLSLGNHNYKDREDPFDTIKKTWTEKCIAVDREHKKNVKSLHSSESVICQCPEGWALKSHRKSKRFTTKVKDYIASMVPYFERTKKRPNFDDISNELKTKRTESGQKEFTEDEWLSPSQIRSLFANFVRKGVPPNKPLPVEAIQVEEIKNDEDLQQVVAELNTLDYHAEMVLVAMATDADE